MSEIRLSTVLGPAFLELAGDVLGHGHTHYDLAGGRGSLKSSTVGLLVPLGADERKTMKYGWPAPIPAGT